MVYGKAAQEIQSGYQKILLFLQIQKQIQIVFLGNKLKKNMELKKFHLKMENPIS